jgi:hypothetical protein
MQSGRDLRGDAIDGDRARDDEHRHTGAFVADDHGRAERDDALSAEAGPVADALLLARLGRIRRALVDADDLIAQVEGVDDLGDVAG